MRRTEMMCELNVLAQFKKFDVIRSHHGSITAEGIETVLKEEGLDEDTIRDYITEFMTLDTNGDGKVSFSDLYESMMTQVPDEWIEWLNVKFRFFWTYICFPFTRLSLSVMRGVSEEMIAKVMTENGFTLEASSHLIEKAQQYVASATSNTTNQTPSAPPVPS